MVQPNRHLKQNSPLTALVANANGDIFEMEGYAAVGMAGAHRERLLVRDTVELPFGSELMHLPDRYPVLYHLKRRRYETIRNNPFEPGKPLFPVAAFVSPGYVNTCVSAYQEDPQAGFLPLFTYAAVGWSAGAFRTAAFRVDTEPRQDLRCMPLQGVQAGIRRKRKTLSKNRLLRHLEHCATVYGCPAAKNFFLQRYEAPLPTARHCNARCLGCLSFQKETAIPCSQNRIDFTPSADEIAQIALSHITTVDKSVVSFGQGCEGDPLTAADIIAPAIRTIRSQTGRGTIHMNTNGSRPDAMAQVIAAGLDSVRISVNSFQPDCYHSYFRPNGYDFDDVLSSIKLALGNAVFVSINYLNSPGFTDTRLEKAALTSFLKRHPIHMIQWRNLNYDPQRYWQAMASAAGQGASLGIQNVYQHIQKAFPEIQHGYFNPPKERFGALKPSHHAIH